jgi:microcystin-dependent protein
LCDGTSVLTSAYAALFAVIGYTFGGTGGSFTLPDFRNRFAVGSGDSYPLASTGGTKDAVVVSHTHGVTDPGHVHALPTAVWASSGSSRWSGSAGPIGITVSGTNSAVTGVSVNTTGVSGTNANLPPYLGLRFIIKT